MECLPDAESDCDRPKTITNSFWVVRVSSAVFSDDPNISLKVSLFLAHKRRHPEVCRSCSLAGQQGIHSMCTGINMFGG